MRSPAIVLSGTLALAIVSVAYWFLSQMQCNSPARSDPASSQDSRIAAAKSNADRDASRERGDSDAARSPCDSPTQIEGAIRVHVCDDAGAPLAGARVGLLKPAEPDRYGLVTAPLEFIDGSAITTDARRIGVLALNDATAIVDVAATAPGFAPSFWPRARAGDEVRVELRPAAELAGFVRDRAGAPVAGATIRWSCDGPRRISGETRSAADGSYRLADVVEFRSLTVWGNVALPWIEVDAEGFAPLRFHCDKEATRIDARRWQLDLWMLRGGKVRGRILDQVSKVPIAGADVFVRGIDGCSPPPPLRTKSGADGSFLLERVPPFGVQNAFESRCCWNAQLIGDLCVVATGHGSAWLRLSAPDDEEEVVDDFELPPVCDVRGRVVDATGAPVENARIDLDEPRTPRDPVSFDLAHRVGLHDSSVSFHTDRDGRFVVPEVPVLDGADETRTVRAFAYDPSIEEHACAGVEIVPVAGRAITAPDIVLHWRDEAPRRFVHFVDEAGRDVPGAEFMTFAGPGREEGDHEGPVGQSVRADRSGRAPLWLPASESTAERRFWVSVECEGFASAVVELPSGSNVTTVTLHPEHRLRGIVRDVDGRTGLAELLVVARRDAEMPLPTLGGEAETTPTTGRFVVRGLPEGPWQVRAVHRGREDQEESTVLENVTEEAGELEIVLPGCSKPLREGWWRPGTPIDQEFGRVEVVVRLADSGRPVLHAELHLGSGTDERADFRAIAPGRFLFEHALPGVVPLRIDVRNARSELRTVAVTAGATAVVAVDVDSGATIAGHVTLAELPAASQLEFVAIEATGGEERSCEIDSGGAFLLRGLDSERRYRFAIACGNGERDDRHWVCGEPPCRPGEVARDWRPRFVAAGHLSMTKSGVGSFPDGTIVRTLDAAGSEVDRYVVSLGQIRIIRHVVLGDYAVELFLPDGSKQVRRAAVTALDECSEVEFDLD